MDVRIDGVRYVPVPDRPTDKGMRAALEVRFDSDAGNGITVRDYLRKLLEAVWVEEEEFNGKRPFGNSLWKLEVFDALVRTGFIEGTINTDGYNMNPAQDRAAEQYVLGLIRAMCHGVEEG